MYVYIDIYVYMHICVCICLSLSLSVYIYIYNNIHALNQLTSLGGSVRTRRAACINAHRHKQSVPRLSTTTTSEDRPKERSETKSALPRDPRDCCLSARPQPASEFMPMPIHRKHTLNSCNLP